MSNNSKDFFSDWIFNSFKISPEGLGLARIFTALFTLLFLLPSVEFYQVLGALPAEFYSPPVGPMQLFSGFPPVIFFWILHGILVFSLLSLLVGYRTPWSSLVAGLSILLIKGFIYSIGKINHELLIPVVLIVMAFSGWGATWSIDGYYKKPKQKISVQSWPLTLLALILGFMMFTAGFPKVLGGWLDLDTHAVLSRYARQFFVKNRQDLLAEYGAQITNPFIWESMDYFTIFFELGFLAAILRPFTTKLFISLALVFHASTALLLNIAFTHNYLAYAIFINWTLVHEKIRQWTGYRYASLYIVIFGLVLIKLASIAGSLYGVPDLKSDMETEQVYISMLALPIALGFLLYALQRSIGKWTKYIKRRLKSSQDEK